MIVFLDTDILVDVALDRLPFSEPAAVLLDKLERNPGIAFVAWHGIANLYYLVRPSFGHRKTKDFIHDLMTFVDIAETGSSDLSIAIRLNMKDFEDAMQVAAALACNADIIATRNVRDYKNSPIRSVVPADIFN